VQERGGGLRDYGCVSYVTSLLFGKNLGGKGIMVNFGGDNGGVCDGSFLFVCR
jgi:hypothetical protein